MNEILRKGFEAQAKLMVEYGYPNTTPEMIKEHHEKWLKGEAESDVLFMFSTSAFEEYPQIFGTPTQ